MKKGLKIFGVIVVVLVVLGIIGNMMGTNKSAPPDKPKAKTEQVVTKPKEDPAKKKAEEEAKAAQEKAKQEAAAKKAAEDAALKKQSIDESINLGIDVSEFESKWQDMLDTLSVNEDFSLKDRSDKTGPVKNTVSYSITDETRIVLTVNKINGMVKEATIISMPSADTNTNTKTILVYALFIGATDPTLEPNERGEVFKGLMDQNPNMAETDVNYEHNNLIYTLMVGKSTGIWINVKSIQQRD